MSCETRVMKEPGEPGSLPRSECAEIVRQLKSFDHARARIRRSAIDSKEDMAIQESFQPKRQPISRTRPSSSCSSKNAASPFGGSLRLQQTQRSIELNTQLRHKHEDTVLADFERKRQKDRKEEGALYGSIRATERSCKLFSLKAKERKAKWESDREEREKDTERKLYKYSEGQQEEEVFYMPPFVISCPRSQSSDQTGKTNKPSKENRRSSFPVLQGRFSLDPVPASPPSVTDKSIQKKKKKEGRRSSMPDSLHAGDGGMYDWALAAKEKGYIADEKIENEWKHIKSDAQAVQRPPEEKVILPQARLKSSSASSLIKLESLVWLVETRIRDK